MHLWFVPCVYAHGLVYNQTLTLEMAVVYLEKIEDQILLIFFFKWC